MAYDEFSKRLKDLRRQKNLTQTELSKMVGVHYSHIGRYEKGQSKPKAGVLKLLAEALGVTTDYLFEGKVDKVAKARLEDQDLLIMFKETEKLPEDDKILVKKFLDAFLTKRKVQSLVKE